MGRRSPPPPQTPAEEVRMLLEAAGLTQVAGAEALGINERTMRYYVGGEPVPRYIILALERLVDKRWEIPG